MELPGLARTLLEGATDLVHPHGQVDSAGGIELYLTAVRGFTDWLVEFGFSGGASDLTRALLARYWRQGVRSSQESALRAMLRCADDQDQILAPDVRAFVDGRLFNTGERYGAHQPYSEAEWARLISTCRDEVDGAFRAAREQVRQLTGQGLRSVSALPITGWCFTAGPTRSSPRWQTAARSPSGRDMGSVFARCWIR